MLLSNKTIRKIIPSTITSLRFISAPVFYIIFNKCSCIFAICLFIFAALTDVVDGKLARKMEVTSVFGAYLDVIADFILIIVAFSAFIKNNWYSIIVLIPIIISFILFLMSSKSRRLIYDPIGKYTGTILMVMIAITLLIPYSSIRKIITYLLCLCFIISMSSRLFFFRKKLI